MTGLHRLHTLLIVDRVLRREKLTARTYLTMRPYSYLSPVKHYTVAIDERVLTYINTMSMVATKWRNDN